MNSDPKTTLKQVDIAPSDELAQGRLVKGFLQAKTVNADARTVEGLASTISLDRDGDVILPAAFRKDINRFLGTNAPFLAAHRHRSDDGTPTQIGWVMDARVTSTALQCTFKYATTDMGEQWWKLAADGSGKGHAFSVGFIPRQYITGTVADLVGQFPELADVFRQAGRKNEDRSVVYTQVELLEISACPVPSNRESLQLLGKLFDSQVAGEAGAAAAAKELEKLVASAVEAAIRNPQSAIRSLLQAAVDNIVADLAVELDRQFSEVKILLPDTVNPNAETSAREGLGEDDDAAAGKAGKLADQQAAAKAFGA